MLPTAANKLVQKNFDSYVASSEEKNMELTLAEEKGLSLVS